MTILALLYVGGGLSYFFEGKPAMFLVLLCYAIANFGLILAANK
jgi:hypothetical protein